ncbi:2,3-bisphosphoglycerate-independent phosphoglycerate mutase [Romboutsia lituseburensis]|uniref:2,3-bisphosphoglycerate-independent phosphoglycerate mutase n=1 Tax=Romboutsia lituseburensis DSM 797 TaxID=1121325 RepID=A0A1G9RS56_9FIRM|nr:2,3-bisphosphoglycerate-independent phosphoglycerate mutase [Romboutsia lituseburensis]CEH32823.1 2,3-bisphosphoglycerate-independent phosphoglycerate mutase [Romboutsia lituseburensis]SDM26036.1 phosphoglycerate mutase [Romboutsia lituseburensis DSM 797]
MKKPIALIIMDGFGESKIVEGNAVLNAKTPNLDKIVENNPHTLINASGLDVGLPDGQMGNSEVGHTNIGAGRIVYQDLTRVSKSINDGDFFKNEVLLQAMNNAKDHSLHLMGLLSDGGVHSHIDHLKGILKMAKENGVKNVFVHAFTDGRDVAPRSALEFIADVEDYMKELGVGKFASVSGRYYAMDRDKRWERVELAYNAMVKGEGNTATSAKEAIEKSYADDKNDEFVVPTVIVENDQPVGTIKEGDSIIFGNFRPDRAREITRAIVDTDFAGFERPNIKTFFVCLTTYDITIKNVNVAFKPQSLENTLGEYLAKNNKTQLRTAETEKYAHVTFFFNGGVEEPNEGEDRLLVPSPKVATYDLQPEMSADELTEKVLAKIDEDKYDFIVLNYANPDMVGHTGVVEAAIKAVETVDTCVGKIVDKIVSKGGCALITADHGNAELMQDPETKTTITAHSINPVPFIVVGEEAKSMKLKEGGRLSDIAPTVLDMMDLEKPEEMTGESLIIK